MTAWIWFTLWRFRRAVLPQDLFIALIVCFGIASLTWLAVHSPAPPLGSTMGSKYQLIQTYAHRGR